MPHPLPGKNPADAPPPATTSRDNSSTPSKLLALSTSTDASAPALSREIFAASRAPPSALPDYAPESPAPPAPAPTLPAARRIAGESGSAPHPGRSSSNTPPFSCDTFPRTPAPPHDTRDQNSAPPAPPG